MKVTLKALLTAGLLSVTGTALAATYNVPADYATIQAAINSSVAGDEIVVAPGIYHEHLVISDRSVSLKSAGGAEQTIIDGDATGTVVMIYAPTDVPVDRRVSLDGFTIQNGVTGISVSGNYTVTANNNIITNNRGGHGVALYTQRMTSDYITFNADNTVISNNTSTSTGAGITAHYHSFPYLKNCKIINNSSSSHGGGIYMDEFGSAELTNTVITGNSAGGNGGGIYAYLYSFVLAKNCLIAQNSAGSNGGAMHLEDGGSARIYNSTIVNNTGWSFPYANITTKSGLNYGNPGFYATNTIIWNVGPYGQHSNFSDPAKVSIDHSIFKMETNAAPYPGEGNINMQPSFVNYAAGDFRLQYWSPGVDQGIQPTGSGSDITTDILGNPRPKGTGFDIGAYEFNDIIAPNTTANDISGSNNMGNGWYLWGAFFTFAITDNVGIKEIHYTINGVESVVSVPPDVYHYGQTSYTVPGYVALNAEGDNTLTYYSVDSFGNAEAPKTKTVKVTGHRPTVSDVITGTKVIGLVNGNVYYKPDATVTITGQDVYGIKEIHYVIGGVETVVPGASATFKVTNDGFYSIRYFAISNTGVESPSSYEYFYIDRTAPTNSSVLTGTINANGWYTTDVNVAITITDASLKKSLNYTLDGVTTVIDAYQLTNNNSATIPITTDGIHTLSFYSIDDAGNVSATTTLTIKIDRSAPFIASSTPANNATGVLTSSSVTLNLNETVTAGSAYANIVLKKGTTTITATKTLSGNRLTIKPSKALSKNTKYTVTVPANAFVDAAGFSNGAYTLSFTTGSR